MPQRLDRWRFRVKEVSFVLDFLTCVSATRQGAATLLLATNNSADQRHLPLDRSRHRNFAS